MLKKFKKDIFLKTPLNKEDKQLTIFLIIFIIIGVMTATYHLQGADSKKPIDLHTPDRMDTAIPKGLRLYEIEISNYELLDSIIGQYGVVDLFTTPLNPNEKAKRVAYSVRIVRAPKNPNKFAVLAPDSEIEKLASYHGTFTVAVKNPNEAGTKFVQDEPVRKKRQVLYDLE